jgi:ribonucleotide reductase beta subunit family protein with ferritin-like domain
VLESTLGLTTFKFVTHYLKAKGLLPGFVEGYSEIHQDETRHIGYCVWFLRETVRRHAERPTRFARRCETFCQRWPTH